MSPTRPLTHRSPCLRRGTHAVHQQNISARKKADRIEVNPMAFFRRTRFSGTRSQWLTRFSGESSVSLSTTAFSRQCRAPGSHSEPSSLSKETESNHRAKRSNSVFRQTQQKDTNSIRITFYVATERADKNFQPHKAGPVLQKLQKIFDVEITSSELLTSKSAPFSTGYRHCEPPCDCGLSDTHPHIERHFGSMTSPAPFRFE